MSGIDSQIYSLYSQRRICMYIIISSQTMLDIIDSNNTILDRHLSNALIEEAISRWRLDQDIAYSRSQVPMNRSIQSQLYHSIHEFPFRLDSDSIRDLIENSSRYLGLITNILDDSIESEDQEEVEVLRMKVQESIESSDVSKMEEFSTACSEFHTQGSLVRDLKRWILDRILSKIKEMFRRMSTYLVNRVSILQLESIEELFNYPVDFELESMKKSVEESIDALDITRLSQFSEALTSEVRSRSESLELVMNLYEQKLNPIKHLIFLALVQDTISGIDFIHSSMKTVEELYSKYINIESI